MVRTRVGYGGGTTSVPTYHHLGDYSETIQFDYDPAIISYQKLLAIFWGGINPHMPTFSRQYRSAIFYGDKEQQRLAEESRAQHQASGKVFVDIMPLTTFYLAEDYHQKYYLRQVSSMMRALKELYSNEADLVASLLAARLNGYVGGHLNLAMLNSELGRLELSAAARQKLLNVASGLR